MEKPSTNSRVYLTRDIKPKSLARTVKAATRRIENRRKAKELIQREIKRRQRAVRLIQERTHCSIAEAEAAYDAVESFDFCRLSLFILAIALITYIFIWLLF